MECNTLLSVILSCVSHDLVWVFLMLHCATTSAASMKRDAALQESARQEGQWEQTLSQLQTELAASHRQVEELQLALFSQQSKAEQVAVKDVLFVLSYGLCYIWIRISPCPVWSTSLQSMREEQQRRKSELETKLRENDQASKRRDQGLTEAQRRCARLEDRLNILQQRRAADLEASSVVSFL